MITLPQTELSYCERLGGPPAATANVARTGAQPWRSHARRPHWRHWRFAGMLAGIALTVLVRLV